MFDLIFWSVRAFGLFELSFWAVRLLRQGWVSSREQLYASRQLVEMGEAVGVTGVFSVFCDFGVLPYELLQGNRPKLCPP